MKASKSTNPSVSAPKGAESHFPSAMAILEERARALSQTSANARVESTGTEVVVFRFGTEHYGIDASLVTGIYQRMPITPIPQTPPHFLGLCNLRGELLCMFDLGMILGAGRTGLTQTSRLIVTGEQTAELGFPVDEVTGVRLVAKSDLQSLPDQSGDPDGKWELIRGVTDDALAILDGKALLNSPKTLVDLKF